MAFSKEHRIVLNDKVIKTVSKMLKKHNSRSGIFFNLNYNILDKFVFINLLALFNTENIESTQFCIIKSINQRSEGKYIKVLGKHLDAFNESEKSQQQTRGITIFEKVTQKESVMININATLRHVEKTNKPGINYQKFKFIIGSKTVIGDFYLIFEASRELNSINIAEVRNFIKYEIDTFNEHGINTFFNTNIEGLYEYKIKISPVENGCENITGLINILSEVILMRNMVNESNVINYIFRTLGKVDSSYTNVMFRVFTEICRKVVSLDFGVLKYIHLNLPYLCKEKVDGERTLILLFNGFYYNIKNTSMSIGSERSANRNLYLIDCEEIEDSENPLIQAFDILIYENKVVTSLPTAERLRYLNKCEKIIKRDFSDNIENYTTAKYMIVNTVDEFYECTKRINNNVERHKYPYNVDGIIFTSLTSQYISYDYKWKPVDKLSIDFMVHFIQMKSGMYQYKIYTIISKKAFEAQELKHESNYPYMSKITENSFPILFNPIEINEDGVNDGEKYSGVSVLYSEVQLEDNGIYELFWDYENSCWKVLKQRTDKTRPNGYNVALINWSLIQVPITRDMIEGSEALPESTRYFTQKTRKNYASDIQIMNGFHSVVKYRHIFISNNFNPGDVLFDIGVGRFGDLKKWLKLGLSKVYVCDMDQSNIDYGLYQIQTKRTLSLVIHPFVGDFLTLGPEIVRRCKGSINEVVAFYSIHYMLNRKESYSKLVNIVDSILKPGGTFFVISFCGQKMFELLKEHNGVYRFEKRGTVSVKPVNFNPMTDTFTIGQKIYVYIETIGENHEEYLIDYDLLNRLFAKKRYHSIMQPFSDFYPSYIQKNRNRRIDPLLQEFSFCYCSVKYTKPKRT